MWVRVPPSAPKKNTKKRLVFIIKPITRKEIDLLLKNKIIRNSHNGMIDNNNNPAGYYGSKTKIYIEDKYVNIARK